MQKGLGNHLIVDCYGCDATTLASGKRVRALLRGAAKIAKLTTVAEHFQQFQPDGVSGVIILAESHLAIHTWPGRGYAAVDLFTCGPAVPAKKLCSFLKLKLGARRVDCRELARGAREVNGASRRGG